ncbi:MAG: M48 family metallopeptidase [Myxococcota bacterium]
MLTATPRLVDGQPLLYLGRRYRLKVFEKPVYPSARLFGGCLHVPGGPGWGPDAVERHVVSWYRDRCAYHFPDRVHHWAERLGVEPPAILISDSQRDWGSYDANGVIRLNWRVIQAPMPLVEYIVARELAQLDYPGHTAAFVRLLGRVMPDYEGRRVRLKELGPRLV